MANVLPYTVFALGDARLHQITTRDGDVGLQKLMYKKIDRFVFSGDRLIQEILVKSNV